ncbi:MAG TPA: 16S rRNA (adenine(1518)-N(6)/adenine(1519)-N(6))-dimethyltransferase RsmA [Thermoanaerobaculia bacterium]|nr:16S rRNA (adenine(1518)-N(6)/adenine(1519)-N(6))-dimethyltransferase RsmA [Thermoanaerobaculia bacterium]
MSEERHRPRKRWGQNFLRDPASAQRIVDAIEPAGDEVIVEIGPGEGMLTERLLRLGHPVTAIEIDPLLVERLQHRLDSPLLSIIHGDATRAALPDRPFRAVGNLPYNVATPILRRVIASPSCRRSVFMVQKEVADRITAAAGDDDYGFLTIFVQLYAQPKIIATLGPGAFRPRPKVKSSVIVFDPVSRPARVSKEHLLELVSASFRMRRKKLVNNLIGYRDLGRAGIETALADAGIEEGTRAEVLSLEDFDRLAAAIEPLAGAAAR